MALAHSPQVVTNGLVFYYDMSNAQKSWKGQPTTNLQDPEIINWGGDARVFLLPGIQSPIGTAAYTVQDNSNTAYLSRSRNITVPNNSNPYTLSIYIKKTAGSVSARLGFNCGLTGGTSPVQLNPRFNSDTGVGTTGSVDSDGDWWRWKITVTNNSTGNTTLYCNFFPATGTHNAGDNVVGVGSATVSAIQIEQNSFATAFVNGTRSNTQAILDLTNNSTITATSLTYASNGTFSFNGSSNVITASSPSMPTDNFTIELVVYPTSFSNSPIVICPQNAGIDQFIQFNTTGTFIFKMAAGGDTGERAYTSATACSLNNYNHIVCVKSGANVTLYLNGISTFTTSSDTTATAGWGNTTWAIGQRGNSTFYFAGLIPVTKAYSRGLTAAEVQQNFSALRGRFGL